MLVLQAVKDRPALAAAANYAGGAEQPQRVRCAGFRSAGGGGQLPYGQLPGLEERIKDAGAGLVAQQTKELCDPSGIDGRRRPLFNATTTTISDHICMISGTRI